MQVKGRPTTKDYQELRGDDKKASSPLCLGRPPESVISINQLGKRGERERERGGVCVYVKYKMNGQCVMGDNRI